MVGLRKRIPSATLVENLVALVIISLCLSIALVILAKVSGDVNETEHLQWVLQVQEISTELDPQQVPLASHFEHLQLVQPTQVDSNHQGINLKKLIPYE